MKSSRWSVVGPWTSVEAENRMHLSTLLGETWLRQLATSLFMGKKKGPRVTARNLAWANDYMIDLLIEVRTDLEKILLRGWWWKNWKWRWGLGFPNAVFWNIWASSIRMEMNWDIVSVLEINISKLDSVRNGQTWGSSSHLDSALAWTPTWLAEGLTSHPLLLLGMEPLQ